jgi:hypothetical protein
VQLDGLEHFCRCLCGKRRAWISSNRPHDPFVSGLGPQKTKDLARCGPVWGVRATQFTSCIVVKFEAEKTPAVSPRRPGVCCNIECPAQKVAADLGKHGMFSRHVSSIKLILAVVPTNQSEFHSGSFHPPTTGGSPFPIMRQQRSGGGIEEATEKVENALFLEAPIRNMAPPAANARRGGGKFDYYLRLGHLNIKRDEEGGWRVSIVTRQTRQKSTFFNPAVASCL